MNRSLLYKIYWKLQRWIAPDLKDSQQIYEEVLNEYCKRASKWLDLGCGHHLLPPWRLEQEQALVAQAGLVVGVDYDQLSLTKHKTLKCRLRGNISRLPFPDNTFDVVTANMVFEHLDRPEEQLKEIFRILSAGGRLIFHTPNKAGYPTLMARAIPESWKDWLVHVLQGRKEEDVFPAYYRINSRADISDLAQRVGFSVHGVRPICSFAQFVVIPPLAVLELLWLKVLRTRLGRPLRPYLIAILQKS